MRLQAAARDKYRQWLIHFGDFLHAKHVGAWHLFGRSRKEQWFKSSFSLKGFSTPTMIGKWAEFFGSGCIWHYAASKDGQGRGSRLMRDRHGQGTAPLGFICAENTLSQLVSVEQGAARQLDQFRNRFGISI
jgi:hypothetical protein